MPERNKPAHSDFTTVPLHEVSAWTVLQNRRRILKNPLPFHSENFERYGDTFAVRITPRTRVVFTRDAGIIRYILQKNHRNFRKSELQTRDLAKYIGHGILTSEGESWRRHRKMIQPAFHKEQLHGLLNLMYGAIQEELARLPAGRSVDVFPYMSDLAFQVVARALFSADDLRKDMKRLQEITETNQRMLIREMRQPYLKFWFQASGRIGRHLRLSGEARTILGRLIDARQTATGPRFDLLDMLLAARYEDGTPMSREQLIDELLILFTAGHETTANALSFALYLLASHPEKQESLYRSVETLDFEAPDKLDLIRHLGYAQQCLEEAMRLYPPVYVIDRVSLEDQTIQGQHFPAGTTWLMSLYELHRHPDLWEDPLRFWPERFDPGAKKEHAGHYFPFGAGPRMCIGNNFAMYEMVLAIGWLIRHFRVETAMTTLELNPLISLKPGQVFLQLVPRGAD